MADAGAGQGGAQLNLAALSADQLRQVAEQLSQEGQRLRESFESLQTAVARYKHEPARLRAEPSSLLLGLPALGAQHHPWPRVCLLPREVQGLPDRLWVRETRFLNQGLLWGLPARSVRDLREVHEFRFLPEGREALLIPLGQHPRLRREVL